MLYSYGMAKTLTSKTASVINAVVGNWYAINPVTVASSYRSDWTNKRSNKGFYTFTLDRTPGSYIG